MYLALIILPLLWSIASGYLSYTTDNPRGAINVQTVPKKFLHYNASCRDYYYTGFCDAEGCFRVKFDHNKKYSIGWHIHPSFSKVSHKRDLLLLKQINEFLAAGQIYGVGMGDVIRLEFYTMAGLRKIMDHLDRYPLITHKKADSELFKEVVKIISRKEHLTQQIVSIRASFNKGLTDLSYNAFPNIESRPSVEFKGILDTHWLAGLADGEGCFFVSPTFFGGGYVYIKELVAPEGRSHVLKYTSCKLGISVSLELNITQHSRKEELMDSLNNFFGCGIMKSNSRYSSLYFVVTKFTDITYKIIPGARLATGAFFDKYLLQSVKYLDYADLCKVVEIMKVKEHLTLKGLEQVRKIKDGINKGRNFEYFYGLRGTVEIENKRCT
jgi:hypothetical protein